MSVKIRLRRVGAKKQPAYRIVVADSRAPRDGRIIENIGHYNPLTNPSTVVINDDRLQYWMGKGAQPTDVIVRLLKQLAAGPVAVVEEAAPVEIAVAPVIIEEVAAEEVVAEEAVVEEAPVVAEEVVVEDATPVAEEVAPVVEEEVK